MVGGRDMGTELGNESSGGGAAGLQDRWENFGAAVWSARQRQGLVISLLADITLTTPELLQQLEAGERDPGRRVAQDLDRALCAGGDLWNAWAAAHVADLFSFHTGARTGSTAHTGLPPTITDVLPETYQVRSYAPLVLPGPYLTDTYTAALQRAEHPMSAPALDNDRPHLPRLTTADGAPASHCLVVDEAALTRHLAPAETIRAQLLHLHHLGQAERITVHLVPADTGPHPGLGGAFWTLCLSPAHTLVYLPHPCGPGHLIADPVTVKAYTDLFATLQGASLPAEDSLHRLTTLAAGFSARRTLTTG